jgi:hypothetical protein
LLLTPWNVKSPVTVYLGADLLDRFALELDQHPEMTNIEKHKRLNRVDLETMSHNRPQRERLPCSKAGISVVKKVKLTVVTGTGERFPFSES